MARWLGLTEKPKVRHFNIDLPDEVTAALREIHVTADDLIDGTSLRNLSLPPDTLVILIKRGNEYLVPSGNTHLYIGDTLLLISREEKHIVSIAKKAIESN